MFLDWGELFYLNNFYWTYVMKLLILATVSFLIGYGLVMSKAVAKILPINNIMIKNEFLYTFPLTGYRYLIPPKHSSLSKTPLSGLAEKD